MLKSRKQPSISEATAASLRPISVDLNFLPDRYRGRGLRILITLRPWLFLLGFALLLIPSAQLFQRSTVDVAKAEAELATVSEALDGYQPLADDRALLETRLISAETQISEFQTAYDAVDIQRVTWSDMVPTILAQVPNGADLSLVSQSNEEVVLEGLANAYHLPSLLADNLRLLGIFEAVTIQSVVVESQEIEPEIVRVEAPAEESDAESSGAEDDAEQPTVIEVVVREEDRPILFRFEITVLLPSFVEPTPEPADEG